MLGLRKHKNPPHKYEPQARATYAKMLDHIRQPVFYTRFGVPDSFDGRFDLLLVHAFMIIHVMGDDVSTAKGFNQALFDVMFADMDQTLREMGIGDMGVPKHMRRMMKAFNGRVQVYSNAIGDDAAFEAALLRNLYGTVETPDMSAVKQMQGYIEAGVQSLRAQGADKILAEDVNFSQIKE